MTVGLDLSAGAVVVLDGSEWIVECTEPQVGKVNLVAAGGERSGRDLRRARRIMRRSRMTLRVKGTLGAPVRTRAANRDSVHLSTAQLPAGGVAESLV